MKGLLVKDLCMIKSYFRTYFLLIIGFIVFSSFSSENAFMFYYPVILAGTLPFSLMSYDERSRWSQYCDTLPVSRKTVVSSRYIMTLVLFLAVFLLTAAAQLFSPYFSPASYAANFSILVVMGLLTPTVLLPLALHFGVEKGRLFYYFIIGAFCALSIGAASAPIDLKIPPLLLPAVSLVLFGISWMISIKIYEKKEF